MPMNDYSKNIVYLSKAQYQELITNNTITVNGQTITYNDNDIYVTPQEEPITTVKINNTTISQNNSANIPFAGPSTLGVVKVSERSEGLMVNSSNGLLSIYPAGNNTIKMGMSSYNPIVPDKQHLAVFYGLAAAAGDITQSASAESVGTYTDEAKGAIQKMLGITDLLAPEENDLTANQAYSIGDIFIANGKLYKATVAIAAEGTIIPSTNCEEVNISNTFLNKSKIFPNYGVTLLTNSNALLNGALCIYPAQSADIKSGSTDGNYQTYRPITPIHQHEAVFYGLSMVAGVDLKNETVTLGTYPETSKTAIRSMIGAIGPTDYANQTTGGVVKIIENGTGGFQIDSGFLLIQPATSANVKNSTSGTLAPLVPGLQHASTFYGLAKAAGDTTQASSDNAIGTYTDSAKIAIRTMLGATSNKIVAVQDTQPTETDNKVWMMETAPSSVQVPTYAEFTAGLAEKVSDVQIGSNSIVSNGVANIPYADSNNSGGIVRANSSFGITYAMAGLLSIDCADATLIKAGTNAFNPIVPYFQHAATFYGLAKAAGADMSSSSNAVGTYTDSAKVAIRTMLGAGTPLDVQINGTSIVSSGVANIPVASDSTYGVVKTWTSTGTQIIEYNNEKFIGIYGASEGIVKLGSAAYMPITPQQQHSAVFYGLAKAAGDTTQKNSNNAVGTYTSEAKTAIQAMLGIEAGATCIETVSGTTPTIIAQPNVRYNCGEVSTISITPPASGTCDVFFTSGSTAAVMTVPNTVKWPEWFDAIALETETIYEIMITDGVYGSVMTWES